MLLPSSQQYVMAIMGSVRQCYPTVSADKRAAHLLLDYEPADGRLPDDDKCGY